MKTRALLGLVLLSICASTFAASNTESMDTEALAAAKLKEMGIVDEPPVEKKPASGFWVCNGVRLHMAGDLTSWQDLDTGDLYTLSEAPTPVDPKDKNHPIKGMNYLYDWHTNPAVVKYFIVDTTGKNLYLRDDLEFYKTYRCKRAK